MRGPALKIFAACISILGCGVPGEQEPTGPKTSMPALSVQQAGAYPETVTGKFVCLADFEDDANGLRGSPQVELFFIRPYRPEAKLSFSADLARTGSGAMGVTLPKASELVFVLPGYRNFSSYSLLSMALYSETLRDDLCITVTTGATSWTSNRLLVRPGWNTALFDIQRLKSLPGFDLTSVRRIGLFFADAAGPVRFNLDDILLVDNGRELKPVPKGMRLRKDGLDYTIWLPFRDEPIRLTQGGDGLWRLGSDQATVQIVEPGLALPAEGERIELMGRRRVGCLEVLEANPVRLRLANTWYFPTRAGEWASLSVRRIRWEYTFYANGCWLTYVELNNSGGREIGSVRMWLKDKAAWSAGAVSRDLVIRPFRGPVGRWSFLIAPKSLQEKTLRENHLHPGAIEPTIAAPGLFAEGDCDRDGFDESQGCYFLKAVKGHCRFTIVPPTAGLLEPVFRVAGQWQGAVSVSSQGLVIREVTQLDDGTILFILPGWIRQPTAVEVVGQTGPTVNSPAIRR